MPNLDGRLLRAVDGDGTLTCTTEKNTLKPLKRTATETEEWAGVFGFFHVIQIVRKRKLLSCIEQKSEQRYVALSGSMYSLE